MKRFYPMSITARIAAGLFFLAVLLLFGDGPARAISPASPAPEATPNAEEQRVVGILKSLRPQTGKIILKDGVADLNVPESFRYLDATDARKVLVDLWGNPPGAAEGTIGMLIPKDFVDGEEQPWAAAISFSEDGYIEDKEPDYDKLLQQVKEAQERVNPERVKEGYSPLHVLGWAQAPHYDRDTKKLYWAKELKSDRSERHSLNYDIRILGRRGAMEVSVIAGMDQLEQINNAAPQILATINFNQGHRYADFNPSTDKKAPYALAGLIGGSLLLAKVGGFKWIIGGLIAMKKFVVLGVVAVAGFFKRVFGGGTKVDGNRPGPPTGTV